MKIIVAKSACFCMGVRRAMDIVLDAAREDQKPVYTYGPLIHNPQVLDMLDKKGISVLDDLSGEVKGRIVIRTHGVSPEVRKSLKEKGYKVTDATCPLVAKVQGTVRRAAKKGFSTVIIGDKGHAEVVGLLGFAEGRGVVINSLDDVVSLPEMEKVCVVGQTTLNKGIYHTIAEAVKTRFPFCSIEETICSATDERQEEIQKIAQEVEAVVVVGGKNSANTAHLAAISNSMGTKTFLVETEEELDDKILSQFKSFGVTAGASTPNWMIYRVIERIEDIGRRSHSGPLTALLRIMDFTIKSNIYISTGAAFLTFATSLMSGIKWNPIFSLISFLYFFSMYNLSFLSENDAVLINKPDKVRFFKNHLPLLFFLVSGSLLLAIFFTGTLGLTPIILILGSSGLGIAYSIQLIPLSGTGKMRVRRLNEIPGSKDLLVASAWATVTTLIPAFSFSGSIDPYSVTISFLFVFIIAYIRSVLFDIRDIQGDRIVGRETVPILLGNERSKIFLLGLCCIIAAVLFCTTFFGLVSSLGYCMILSVAYTAFYLFLYHKRVISQGVSCEWVVDGTFLFTGNIGLIYYVWQGMS